MLTVAGEGEGISEEALCMVRSFQQMDADGVPSEGREGEAMSRKSCEMGI